MIEFSLLEHQKKAVEFAKSNPAVGLFFEMGTGKTLTAIKMLEDRFTESRQILPTLILCPKIVCTNWRNEFQKFSHVPKQNIHVLLGSGAQRLKILKNAVMVSPNQIFIMNYEGLQMKEVFGVLKSLSLKCMVLDEAHRIKDPGGARAKLALDLAYGVRYKYALTGTPILNSLMDIFNIFKFLDNGKTFGENFYRFRSRWFIDENSRFAGRHNYFPKWAPRPEAFDEFNKIIYTICLRAKKSECLDLPKFTEENVYVQLGADQARMYKEMKKDFLTYVATLTESGEPQAVVAQLAVTKSLRLLQIVTGHAKTDAGEIFRVKDNPRLKALEELLEEHAPEHKIIVWSIFKENYQEIKEACANLKLKYSELHGGILDRDRDEMIRSFQEEPEVRVMIANQQAGGIGVNLTASDLSIFYSRSFNFEHDEQAEGRNYRKGSEVHKSVTRINIVAEGTIDELVAESLLTKEKVSLKILDGKNF